MKTGTNQWLLLKSITLAMMSHNLHITRITGESTQHWKSVNCIRYKHLVIVLFEYTFHCSGGGDERVVGEYIIYNI